MGLMPEQEIDCNNRWVVVLEVEIEELVISLEASKFTSTISKGSNSASLDDLDTTPLSCNTSSRRSHEEMLLLKSIGHIQLYEQQPLKRVPNKRPFFATGAKTHLKPMAFLSGGMKFDERVGGGGGGGGTGDAVYCEWGMTGSMSLIVVCEGVVVNVVVGESLLV
ncbi:hypothetical protein Tco_0898597 [Tanacetum coccineum]